MSVSCNAKFSDSTGDSSDSKMAFHWKKSPLNTQFFAYALLSLAKHAVVSRKSANQLQYSCVVSRKSANQLQYSCNPSAVLLRIIRSTTAEASQ